MLENYAHLLAGTFFRLKLLSIWVPGHNSVPGNVTMSFTTTMVCYSGFRVLLVHSVVLGNYTLFYFATMMAGYSILGFYSGGYAFFQVHKNLQ